MSEPEDQTPGPESPPAGGGGGPTAPGGPGAPGGPTSEMSEEQYRAALEEQMREVRVEDLLLQSVASLINLSARRIAKEDERDLDQARLGIESVRAVVDLLPPEPAGQVKNALSELQMLYAQAAGGGSAPTGEGPAGGSAEPGGGDDESGSGGGGSGGGESPRPPRPQSPGPASPGAGEPPPRLWTPGSAS